MSEKKEQYRVIKPWAIGEGGKEIKAGTIIDGPIHPALLSNVQKVVGEIVTGDSPKESKKILDAAKSEAEKIISAAKAEAEKLIDAAKADANSLLDEAQKDALSIVEEAKKGA